MIPESMVSSSLGAIGVGNGVSSDINLLHMELIHHFLMVTANTLIFGKEVWQRDVVTLSFQVPILCHLFLLT
jgi:hypothetical protein